MLQGVECHGWNLCACASCHAHVTGRGSRSSLVLSIARRVCADAVRKLQRRLVDKISQSLISSETPASDGSLDYLMSRLDPDRCEVFVLTQQLGLSYEEAAEVLGCPLGTVRSRLARARADLFEAVRSAETG